MKYKVIGLLLLALLTSFAAPKLKPVKITKALTVSLPQDFAVMPDDAIAAKYPAPRKPLGAFTSPNGQVDFVASERPITFKPEDLKMLQQFYKSSITNKFSEVKFIRDEIKAINKQDYIVFEFTSMVRDEDKKSSRLAPIRKYTIIQYTIMGDKLYSFTFNAPVDLKPVWEETARKIMASIKLDKITASSDTQAPLKK